MDEKTGYSSDRTGGRNGEGRKEEVMEEKTGYSSERTGGRNGEGRKERGSNGGKDRL